MQSRLAPRKKVDHRISGHVRCSGRGLRQAQSDPSIPQGERVRGFDTSARTGLRPPERDCLGPSAIASAQPRLPRPKRDCLSSSGIAAAQVGLHQSSEIASAQAGLHQPKRDCIEPNGIACGLTGHLQPQPVFLRQIRSARDQSLTPFGLRYRSRLPARPGVSKSRTELVEGPDLDHAVQRRIKKAPPQRGPMLLPGSISLLTISERPSFLRAFHPCRCTA